MVFRFWYSRCVWQVKSKVKRMRLTMYGLTFTTSMHALGHLQYYCTISINLSPHDFFYLSDKSPKTAKTEKILLPLSAVTCDQ